MSGSIPSQTSDAQAVARILLSRTNGGGATIGSDKPVNASQLKLPADRWQKVDRNGDGFVDKAELAAALAKVPAAELAAFRKKADGMRPSETVMTTGIAVGMTSLLGLVVAGKMVGFKGFAGLMIGLLSGSAIVIGGLAMRLFSGRLGPQEKAIMDKLG